MTSLSSTEARLLKEFDELIKYDDDYYGFMSDPKLVEINIKDFLISSFKEIIRAVVEEITSNEAAVFEGSNFKKGVDAHRARTLRILSAYLGEI